MYKWNNDYFYKKIKIENFCFKKHVPNIFYGYLLDNL